MSKGPAAAAPAAANPRLQPLPRPMFPDVDPAGPMMPGLPPQSGKKGY